MQTEASRKIGLKIVELRRGIKKSCEQLALDVGISPQQMWKYEAGISRITVDRLIIIADVLGVKMTDFFSEGDFGKAGEKLTFSKRDYKLLGAIKNLREREMFIDDLLLSASL